MRAPDTAGRDPTTGDDPSGWPTVRRASGRFVVSCRAFAVLALAYGIVVAALAAGGVARSAWLWVAIVFGALVHLLGVVGLWLLAPHAPKRVLPRPGPGAGTGPDRTRARRALRAGGRLGAEQRRLVAGEVAAGARVPVVAAGAFALLGPVAMGTPNTDLPLPWLGPVTAAVVLLVLAALAWQVRSVRWLHRAAGRADALPAVEGRDAPYLP